MLPKRVHDPDYWIEELDPLLRDLDFAFRLAVPKAHSFFTDFHKKQINRPVLSNLIRYHTLEYLWSQGFDTNSAKEEGGDDGWGLRGLPNNGIELLYKNSCIRVRKGIDPPYPTTISSQEFYQQRLFQEGIDSGVVTNLLILYNLNVALQYDGDMKLMRPIRLNAKKKSVKCEWSKAIDFRGVDLSRTVPPQYAHGSELPLSGPQDSAREDTDTRTGTDDKPKDAD
jgi:hypothetical protein